MKIRTKPEVKLERISWDQQARLDFSAKRGFVIDEYAYKDNKLKEKNPRGIHSQKFGTSFSDDNAFMERYSCKCKNVIGMVYNGEICPVCKTEVVFVDVNVEMTGWVFLKADRIIQPLYYRFIKKIVRNKGFSIEDMLKPNEEINKEGVLVKIVEDPTKPFLGIGIQGLYERWDEVLEYYHKLKPNMRELIDMIRHERHVAFSSSIPVYSSILRNTLHSGSTFYFNNPENIYGVIVKKVNTLNSFSDLVVVGQHQKERDRHHKQLTLFDIQQKVQAIWQVVFSKIDAKRGHIRSEILGGRINFSARNVIVPDATLRADEIDIGYLTFLELYRYEIIGYLVKMTDMTYEDASQEWFESTISFNQRVYEIMLYIVENNDTRVLVNRNPTIKFGSLICMKIRKVRPEYTDNHTMSLPLFVLRSMNADFDGDTLNIVAIKIKDLAKGFDRNYNPRKSLIISRNDGLFNDDFNLLKDQMHGLYHFNNI